MAKITDPPHLRRMGYGVCVKTPSSNGLAWIIGAITVVVVIGLFLWATEPEDPLLPQTYTVM
jgi:hypothetical protein